MASSYQIFVQSPCNGDQIVNQIIPTYYTGTSGSFTNGILALPPGATKWKIEIVDFGSGACSPSVTFEQKVGNTSDPVGEYEEVGSGTGKAEVKDYP